MTLEFTLRLWRFVRAWLYGLVWGFVGVVSPLLCHATLTTDMSDWWLVLLGPLALLLPYFLGEDLLETGRIMKAREEES